jgi:putative membrane protein
MVWHNLFITVENLKTMIKGIFNILLLSLFLAVIACESKKTDDSAEAAEEQNDENLDDSDVKKDADFAVEVADAGLLEVQLGTLAASKATSPSVKQFAQMMVDDHTKANNELKDLAQQKSIVLPDVMSEDCQKKYYDMDKKEKGEDFDKEYIDQMVKDHKDNIDKFEKEADKGNDPDIKSWAAGKLATLRNHLEEAERIQSELKK